MTRNLIVGQSGGPTAVINVSLAGVIQTAFASSQIDRVFGAVNGIRGLIHEELVDLQGESDQTIELLQQTPGAALGTSRQKLTEDHIDRVLAVLEAHDVRYFCLIGGNDSMATANEVSRLADRNGYELQVIGVPKTVDNDIAFTDHCPGYGSAARFVATTVRDTGIDTEAGKLSTPVKIVEIMGRHAGWLTASAALAREGCPDGAPHLIYVPERPISLDDLLSDVGRVYRERGCVVIALSEGVRNPDGEFLGLADTSVDTFGHQQLGGVSMIMAQKITRELGLKTRFEKPDTMQRSSTALVSPVDRSEAFMVGQAAVYAIEKGETGKMITLQRESGAEYACHSGLIELEKVAGIERTLPAEFLSADGMDVTMAFIDYAFPLIGGALQPVASLAGRMMNRQLPPWNNHHSGQSA